MEENLEHNNLISRWLNGDLTEVERAELEQSGELNDLKYVIEDIDTWSLGKHDVEKGLKDLEAKNALSSKPKGKILPLKPVLRYAAVITLLIAAYLGWDNYFSSSVFIETGIGQTIEHQLPDGSVVHLDAMTSISYSKENWQEKRAVELSGQAYFDVKKGSTFSTITARGSVEVLGTEFSVRSENDIFIVNCFEGKVAVTSGTKGEVIIAGEGVVFQNENMEKRALSLNQPDWMQGYVLYDKVTLIKVITDLQKYFNVTISLPEKYGSLQFSGKVPTNNLKQALKTIFVPMEINYTITEDDKVVFN